MATKPPPPPKKTTKGEPPPTEVGRDNLKKPEPGGTVDLNFKVSAEFRKNFKIASVEQGMTQAALLKELFRFWQEQKGL
jgi:hypothetical protein